MSSASSTTAAATAAAAAAPAVTPAVVLRPTIKFTGKARDFRLWSLRFSASVFKAYGVDLSDVEAVTPDQSKLLAYELIEALDDVNLTALARHGYDGKEMWKELYATYYENTHLHRAELRQRLSDFKLRTASDIVPQLMALQRLIDDLSQCGETINDERKKEILIDSLDEEMEHVIPVIITTCATFEAAVNQVKLHVKIINRRRRRGGKPDTASNKKKKKGATSRPTSQGLKCSNCQRMGHDRSTCFKVGGGAFKPFEGECRRCGQRGHDVRACKETKKRNTSKEGAARVLVEGMAEAVANDAFNATFADDEWIVDSGASHFITKCGDLLENYRKATGTIRVGDEHPLPVVGQGSFTTHLKTREGKSVRVTWNAIHVPKMAYNLLSERQWKDSGGGLACPPNRPDYLTLPKGTGTVSLSRRQGQLYLKTGSALIASAPQHIWHRRLAHAGDDLVERARQHTHGIVISQQRDPSSQTPCESCLAGKMKESPFARSQTEVTEPGAIVEADLQGPFPCVQHDKSLHRLTLIDHATDYRWTYSLKRKSEAPIKYNEFLRDSGLKVKVLRIDGAGELSKGRLLEQSIEDRTRLQRTNPHTPEQIGKVGKAQDTATNDAKSMLYDAELTNEFFGYAFDYSVWIRNRLPTRGGATPFERLTGKKPDLSGARVFGSIAYRHVRKSERNNKLSWNMRKCVFLGFKEGVKGYFLLDAESGRVTTARTVKFDENSPGGRILETTEGEDNEEDFTPHETAMVNSPEPRPTEQEGRAQRRRRKAPTEWWKGTGSANLSYGAAMRSPQCHEWKNAMQKELAALEAMGAWNIVNAQDAKGHSLIRPMWRLQEKLDEHGKIHKLKARLVARGDMQLCGEDYGLVHAPVVTSKIINLFSAVAIHKGWTLKHIDFATAFLNSDLEEEIYMHPPSGMNIEPGKVLRLRKSLYGLKQSGRNWYQCLSKYLVEIGFKKLQSDRCVFVRQRGEEFIAIGTHVDDLLTLTDSDNSYEKLLEQLSSRFKLGDCGDVRHYCGIVVQRDAQKITLSQPYYTESILEAFNMQTCNPRTTPAEQVPLRAAVEGETTVDKNMFASAIGSLLWLATNTRPDIAFSVQRVSRYAAKPTQAHWNAVKQILRYLRSGTRGLVYKKSVPLQPVVYSDADFGGDKDTRRSTLGMCVLMAGAPVVWRSVRARNVVLSTTEAEYGAQTEGARAMKFIYNLLTELNLRELVSLPVTFCCDNQSTIALINNEKTSARTRHIDIELHYVRELAAERFLEVKYVPTRDMIADILTKPLNRVAHAEMSDILTTVL